MRLFLLISWFCVGLMPHSLSYAQATKNLWLCPDDSGIDSVMYAAVAPQGCEPYSTDKIKHGNKQSTQQTSPISAHRGKLTIANDPPPGLLPERPAPLDFTGIAYAPLTSKPIFIPKQWQIQPHYRSDIEKIYLCHVDGQSQVVESQKMPSGDCTLMGVKMRAATADALRTQAKNSASLAESSTPEIELTLKPTATASSKLPTSNPNASQGLEDSNVEKIYLCQSDDGKQSIVQSKKAPSINCDVMGIKGASNTTSLATKTRVVNKPSKASQSSQSQTIITTTTSSPGDIYRCHDSSGKMSFVNEESIDDYRNCQFFSRSFSSLAQDLARGTNLSPSSSTPATNTTALRCSGAGEVILNGQTHKYNCATRSYDHTPGSSGGEIQLGDRRAIIPAYSQDYLNTSGSCGGTVTSENGRVLHLEPTKDCPDALKIVAAEIARTVQAGLNIQVGGAFLARQRKLSAQINRIAREVGIDPYLVHAVISAESAYKPNAVSHAGARGLMQLMPATAARFNVSNSFHTGQNIRGGATYLKWLLKRFNGNMKLAIAGYNAGEGNVIKYGYKIPPFIETKAYVPKVMQYYRRYHNNPSLIGL